MEDMVNANVVVNAKRLDWPLRAWHARVGHSFSARLHGVPGDVAGVFARVFRVDGSYSDFRANMRPNGEWLVYVIGTAFPAVGSARYELHGTDARGNAAALGCGLLDVRDFSVTAEPVEPGAALTVAQIPTADGSFVQIRMVRDTSGEWVYEAVGETAAKAEADREADE
jgi:hypothetical protein